MQERCPAQRIGHFHGSVPGDELGRLAHGQRHAQAASEISRFHFIGSRGPRLSTVRHSSRVAGSFRSAPPRAAVAAIERSMTVVVVGTSTNMPDKPNKPPTAPVVAATAVCNPGDRENLDAGFSAASGEAALAAAPGSVGNDRKAQLKAVSSADEVACITTLCAFAGRALSTASAGLPTRLASRMRKLGCSR